ncbi:MAG: DUF1016 N-terminal domain-containing protein [Candidatus Anammoxibacter sp.]
MKHANRQIAPIRCNYNCRDRSPNDLLFEPVIVERQKNSAWGSVFLKQLSKDLMTEFPAIKGFSLRNVKYVRQ